MGWGLSGPMLCSSSGRISSCSTLLLPTAAAPGWAAAAAAGATCLTNRLQRLLWHASHGLRLACCMHVAAVEALRRGQPRETTFLSILEAAIAA
jgi:hypothetical protein